MTRSEGRPPLIDEDGEARDVTAEDLKRSRPWQPGDPQSRRMRARATADRLRATARDLREQAVALEREADALSGL